MIQVIQMSQRYQKSPSEILHIEYDYLAYMVDEFAFYLEMELTDDNGYVDWDKLHKRRKKPVGNNANKEMMEHMKKYEVKESTVRKQVKE